ncbi:hypothetical protein V2J09_007219 [Rumex salicifolius]
MSNGTKPDFAKKLLNDLKMRKERMAATHNSVSADTYGSSRRSLKGSSDMKSIAKASSNTSKPQRSSNRSQSTRMNVENSNQIVPYGEPNTSKQPLDLSMTLSYALDDNGKLKNMNLTGSSAMIGFLRQISRRSMDDISGNSQIHWPSSAQFPTLTSLHVDEVSKGAQRLNHILKSFYKGLNNTNGSSVHMGKELLKGAMELEESLRMLVSLQEAVPQKKSRVKLLEMGEEKDEGKQDKRVERPVFSFDHGKDKKKVSSHRRSASSPVTSSSSSSSQINSKSGGSGIPNVVAKLMGLEDIPRNGVKSNNQLNQSNKGLDQIVSQRMSFGDEDEWRIGSKSNKIVILTSKKIKPQKEIDERKPAWSQREKEQIITHIMELKNRSEIKENVGVKRALPKDEVQKTGIFLQGRTKDNGVSTSLKHPKSPQRVEAQRKNRKVEPRNIKKGFSKPQGRRIEASERVIECSLPKDIHEVKSSKPSLATLVQAEKGHREMVLYQDEVKSVANEREANNLSEAAIKNVKHDKKMLTNRANQKANEVMAKPVKSANKPSKAMKQQETIMQGLKQRKPVNKGSQQPNIRLSRRVESEAFGSKNAKANTYKDMEIQQNQEVNLEVPCNQVDPPLMLEKDPESKPQERELIHLSDFEEKQQPLTGDEIYLKKILITSQVFLNTAEALFKLNIPLGILNASFITCQEEEEEEEGTKLITECAYEMLKMKGKRRELVFYNRKNAIISNMRLKTLDDLVRQLHKDFEKLRTYGKTMNSDKDHAEYLLKMVERDMHHKDMDVNCMWDLGWIDSVFAYVEMDEVIRDVEKCVINELIDGVLEEFMEISVTNVHGENMRNGVLAC